MKNKTKLVLLSILIICILSSCIKENGGTEKMDYNELFNNLNQPLSSFSGSYEAIIEEFDDNGVKSFKLYIMDVNNNEKAKYTADLVFRARDKNYVFWADEEDILWGYSGDVGTYFWINEDGVWVQKAYANNPNAIVPQMLKDARPNLFK